MKLLIVSALLAAVTPIQAALSWQNVKIGGGGGFVPGIVFHPKTKGLAYARTDIGGLYRLNADESWTAVTDGIADHEGWHNWGIDALALDPQDDNKVYAAVGMYTNSWDPSNGAIIRSSDKGATWSFADLSFKVGGNMPGRGMGERLAVDPANSDIIYFGARSGNGLWKSADGGATFKKVTSYTAVGTFVADPSDTNGYNSDIQGLSFVTFDSTFGTTGGATKRIFVGTADNTTASLYVSNDAGSTWEAVEGQPDTYFPHKGVIQPEEKALYVTYSDGSGPYDGTHGAVYRYDLSTSEWKDITPATGSDLYFGFGGLGLDMQNPGTLVVAALNSWWPEAKLFRSTDSGATWSPLWSWNNNGGMDRYYGISTPKAPWIYKGFISVADAEQLGWMIESLEIDPFDADHWLYGTGLTIYGGHDLTSWDTEHNVTIESLADGIEEFAVQDLASAPGGPELLAAIGDDSGFTFAAKADLGTAPQTNWVDPEWSTATGVDFAGNEPASVVRVGNGDGGTQAALSTDGGATWYAHPGADTSTSGGAVALSADGNTVLWSSATEGVLRSGDGAAFTAVASLPSGAAVASDKRDNAYFYGGGSASGALYVSSDAGESFTEGGALAGAAAVRHVAAHPDTAGTVLVSTDAGLFRSDDHGATFAKLGGISNTYAVALGAGAGGGWNLYAFGTGAAGARLYGSADGGASWADIQGDDQGFGAIDSCRLAGSGNEAGLVYVGTNGRGVFWAQGEIA